MIKPYDDEYDAGCSQYGTWGWGWHLEDAVAPREISILPMLPATESQDDECTAQTDEGVDPEPEPWGWRLARGPKSQALHLTPAAPLRFEGQGLVGSKITIRVPKQYCEGGNITRKGRERLAKEGYCAFAERSWYLWNCEVTFVANDKEQWGIKIEKGGSGS